MTETPKRYPLGLPRGSVRAILALSVYGTVIALLLLERSVQQGLWLVNYIILGYYFASRQHNHQPAIHQGPSPLHLPRGTVRWLIVLSFLGSFIYLFWQFTHSQRSFWQHKAFFPLISLSSFFLGRLFQAITLRWKNQNSKTLLLFADIKAGFAVLCALGVLSTHLLDLSFPGSTVVERFCTDFILFYFGSR